MSAIHYGIPWKQVLSGGFTDAIVVETETENESESEIPRRLETNECTLKFQLGENSFGIVSHWMENNGQSMLLSLISGSIHGGEGCMIAEKLHLCPIQDRSFL